MWHVVALAGIVAGQDVAPVQVAPGELRAANLTHTVYLNRCVGGCLVQPGSNDASTNHSSLVSQTVSISEFQYSDLIWDSLVACVREVYAPYDVTVVTDDPGGSDYIEAMVAGSPSEIGQPSTTLGYSPMATDCSPQRNWIAFVFANIHGSDPLPELCATVAHETGHVFGLDHTLTCKDAMSYGQGCGQKFFLNLNMECGESDPRECSCGHDRLNTHAQLLEELGAGTTPPAPTVTLIAPSDGAMVSDGFSTFGTVEEKRIVDRVEFWMNDFPWKIAEGDPEVDTYSYMASSELPDGIIELEVRAYNDLQLSGSATATITKGEPCTSAGDCAADQLCDDGRCHWPPPTQHLGDECTRDADCDTYRCESDGNVSLCSQRCVVGDDASCGDGFTCLAAGDHGACWPTELLDHGGCCSTGGGAGGSALLAGLLVILGRGRRPAARPSRR